MSPPKKSKPFAEVHGFRAVVPPKKGDRRFRPPKVAAEPISSTLGGYGQRVRLIMTMIEQLEAEPFLRFRKTVREALHAAHAELDAADFAVMDELTDLPASELRKHPKKAPKGTLARGELPGGRLKLKRKYP